MYQIMKNVLIILKPLADRLKAESPKFWIKVRNIATIIFSAALAVNYLPEILSELGLNYTIPIVIINIAGKIIGISMAVGLTSVFTKKDSIEISQSNFKQYICSNCKNAFANNTGICPLCKTKN